MTAMVGRIFVLIAVTTVGLILGIRVGGSTSQNIGPFESRISLSPSFVGTTKITIPPLGSLELDSHTGPVALSVHLETLDEAQARNLVTDPTKIEDASNDAVKDLAVGVRTLVLHTAGWGLLGAMIFTGLIYRSTRHIAISGGLALGLMAGTALVVQATFRPDAIQEPRYEGLLTNAPAVVGDARRIANQYEEYRKQLQRLVTNVSKIYSTISSLPVYEPDVQTTRVLHISDMHLNPAAWSVITTIVQQFSIDIVVDTGDITDWGSEAEDSYTNFIGKIKVPYVFIQGNHDSANTVANVAHQPNAKVLTSSTVTLKGLTFAGIGDPRFTPDKSATNYDREVVRMSGANLAKVIRTSAVPVDVALIHDPVAADPLAFAAPVILAGHTHKRDVRRLEGPEGSPKRQRSLLMVQGSTGGAGLRGLERAEPLPLALSVLYFDASRHLQAYDDIKVGGTGLSQVSLERHLVAPDNPTAIPGTPEPGSAPERSSHQPALVSPS